VRYGKVYRTIFANSEREFLDGDFVGRHYELVCYAKELIREGKILGIETRIKRDIRDYLYAPISKFRRKLASVPDVWSVCLVAQPYLACP
jgi:hypothetical protein